MSDSDESSAPALELDFGIGRVYVKGDEDTSFEEVAEEFNEQKEDMKETIERLKELEYELAEEYDESGGSGMSDRMVG